MSSESPAGSWLRPLRVLVQIIIALCVVVLAVVVLLPGGSALGIVNLPTATKVEVPVSTVEGLRAAPDALAPGTEISGDVGLTLTDPGTFQLWVAVVSAATPTLLLLVVMVLLNRVVTAALRDGAFTATVARGLRVLGVFTVVGSLGAAVVELAASTVLTLAALDGDNFAGSLPVTLPTIALGVGALAVAEIIRHGLAMREDLEGTV